MDREKIKQHVNENFEAVVELHKQLCKIPAPSLHEEKRAKFCKEWLENVGAKGVYIDEALNVIYPINCEGKNHITVFVAHTDTVFPDMTEPMPYLNDGEKIYSPGCGDDTASVAVLMFCAKYLIENAIVPENGLLLVLNAAEEGLGNLYGTRTFMKAYEGRIKQFISFDSSYEKMTDRCVGSCRYNITVKTEGGHSYNAFGNRNAIHALSEIITKIYSIEIPQDGFSKTTLNVGKISGGTSVNTIAQKAEMLCEYRSDNKAFLEVMRQHFLKIFEEVASEQVEVEIEVVGERPCAGDVDLNEVARLKEMGSRIVQETTGVMPICNSGSTDCNIPMSIGIPAVCIGVYFGDGTHTREEWILKESFRPGLEIGIRAILEMGNE